MKSFLLTTVMNAAGSGMIGLYAHSYLLGFGIFLLAEAITITFYFE